MFRLLCFGVFICVLQKLSSELLEPITYEYSPPPIKGNHVFIAVLEPVPENNDTKENFMYHYKHQMYASGFLAETFLLGIGNTHIFDNEEIDIPNNELRHISIAVGAVWTKLPFMKTINSITMKYCNYTAHYFLQEENNKRDTFKYLFKGVEETIKKDARLKQAYLKEKEKVERRNLPPLNLANITLQKFGGIEKKLAQKVYNRSEVLNMVAHARFSQNMESDVKDVTKADYDEVFSAHALVKVASDSTLQDDAQKAYEETISEAISSSSEILKARNYSIFDKELFIKLNKVVLKYPKLNSEYMLKKKSYNFRTRPS